MLWNNLQSRCNCRWNQFRRLIELKEKNLNLIFNWVRPNSFNQKGNYWLAFMNKFGNRFYKHLLSHLAVELRFFNELCHEFQHLKHKNVINIFLQNIFFYSHWYSHRQQHQKHFFTLLQSRIVNHLSFSIFMPGTKPIFWDRFPYPTITIAIASWSDYELMSDMLLILKTLFTKDTVRYEGAVIASVVWVEIKVH